MSRLFSELTIRGVRIPNRIFVSPMCQYSSEDGHPTDWHLVHLGSRAVGGAGLVMVEATAVSPKGRISPWDSGMWSEEHAAAFRPITAFIRAQGSIPAIQLAHAGRKASTDRPWTGGGSLDAAGGGWAALAPSPVRFSGEHPIPREMTEADMEEVIKEFAAAAVHSREAGFEVLELHMAHGYLMHQFLSPLVNQRRDAYGGSFENRARLPRQVVTAVREVWPEHLPLFVRISATDWVEGGWDLEQSLRFARLLQAGGVDLIDCSSAGAVAGARIPVAPGYQVAFAEAIRREVGIPTGAVGLITDPQQAEEIVAKDRADAVLLGREFLRQPYWPLHAARALGVEIPWPVQYERARI